MAGVREARKQATRERVLSAARELFVEVGYDATTIRVIADRAGVATGSVFTTFPSKIAILRAVMDERLEGLCLELEGVAPHLRGSVTDQLCSIMAVHYDFEMKRPRLFTAFLAANFEWSDGEPIITYGRQSRLTNILHSIVRRGVDNGEVRADADIDVFIELLLSAYALNYRHAAQFGMKVDGLIARMDQQIGLLTRAIAA